jgi:polyhydroxybutyrate depolymerase
MVRPLSRGCRGYGALLPHCTLTINAVLFLAPSVAPYQPARFSGPWRGCLEQWNGELDSVVYYWAEEDGMNDRYWVLLALLGAALSSGAVAAPRQLNVGGVVRTYELHIPAGVRDIGRPVALVVALHGGSGTGAQVRQQLQLDRVADREGFVVAYPNSLGQGWARRWNDGRVFADRRYAGPEPDDVAFIRALIKELATSHTVDPTRVFATGVSNGGMMSFRLACEASDLFAAVATIVAQFPTELVQACKPSQPFGVLMVTGTADPLVPFAGGPIGGKGGRGSVVSADETFALLRRVNGCAIAAKTADQRGAIEIVGVGDVCAGGRKAWHYRMRGAGHQIPLRAAARQPLIERWLGPRNGDIEASEEIWTFFAEQGRFLGAPAVGR